MNINVSRKTKIRISLACVAFATVVVALVVREFNGEVRVVFSGVSPEDSTLVSFGITNTFREPVVYYLEGQLDTSGAWGNSTFHYTNYTGRIMGRSAEIIGVKAHPASHWRVFVRYGNSWRTSFVEQTRATLARFASDRNWTRISEWLRPRSSFRRAPSPEMMGSTSVEGARR